MTLASVVTATFVLVVLATLGPVVGWLADRRLRRRRVRRTSSARPNTWLGTTPTWDVDWGESPLSWPSQSSRREDRVYPGLVWPSSHWDEPFVPRAKAQEPPARPVRADPTQAPGGDALPREARSGADVVPPSPRRSKGRGRRRRGEPTPPAVTELALEGVSDPWAAEVDAPPDSGLPSREELRVAIDRHGLLPVIRALCADHGMTVEEATAFLASRDPSLL